MCTPFEVVGKHFLGEDAFKNVLTIGSIDKAGWITAGHLHEWPVVPLCGSTNFFALAAFLPLRAHAAQNHNGQVGLSTADRGMKFLGPFWVGERQQPPANDVQMSIRSAMLSASSSSTPKYRTVLSTFVWPSRSCTARRLPVLR